MNKVYKSPVFNYPLSENFKESLWYKGAEKNGGWEMKRGYLTCESAEVQR